MSHSTGVSAHSITQTVLSLLGADEEDADADAVGNVTNMDIEANTSPVSPRSTRRIQRYFRPLWRMAYYRPLIHLLVINFFYALVAFVYLFAGTLVSLNIYCDVPMLSCRADRYHFADCFTSWRRVLLVESGWCASIRKRRGEIDL